MSDHLILAGAGLMAQEYAKVLQGMKHSFTAVGRGEESAAVFREKTGIAPVTGGIDSYLAGNGAPEAAIVAVGVEALSETATALLKAGCRRILIEKPGGCRPAEITALAKLAEQCKADVLLAYNRRFFASTLAAEKLIEADGGVESFSFEFTEWSHTIAPLRKGAGVKEHWFLANSTHVSNLAFFLGGNPVEISSYTRPGQRVDWHPASAVFAGAGYTDRDALFSYRANWQSAGRWQLEVLTAKRRLLFCPMEKLQEQLTGTIPVVPVEGIDYALDEQYKPGLYRQTAAFLTGDDARFMTIQEQAATLGILLKIAGYPS